MCVSRLVIVPKLAPGQSKDDPEHGFRVCVNALINKCLKPCASTIPLATDEITKLHGMKYYLQADGASGILEHTSMRREQKIDGVSYARRHLLLE